MSFYRKTEVKRTRKACRCDWCGEAIESGSPSVVVNQVFAGDFFSNRYHPECNAALSRWSKTVGYGEELPDEPMNRGGVKPKGETEPEETE